MNFIKRLFVYWSKKYSLGSILPFTLFTWLRNHPFQKGGYFNSIIPYIALRPVNFKGKFIQLDTSNFSHSIIADEFIVHEIYDLNKVPFTPDVIYDCGAHIGLFSVLAHAHFPSTIIYSFEPLPENYEMIEKQIKINKIVNINIQKAAVSTSEGSAYFFTSDSSFGGSLNHKPDPAKLDKIKVKLLDLNTFLIDQKPTKILLKIDIEGEEENVFPHIIKNLPKICALFFETHSIEGKQKIYELLQDNGFTVEQIREVNIYGDHFAIRNELS